MDNLELTVKGRAEGEQLNENIDFLNSLMGGGSESKPKEKPKAKPEGEALKKPKSSKTQDKMPEGDAVLDLPKSEKTPPVSKEDTDANMEALRDIADGNENGGVLKTASSVAKDVAGGTKEAPEQIVGGVMDAFNAMIGVMEIVNERYPTGGTQIFDPDGNFDPQFLNAQEMAANLNAQNTEGASMGSLLPKVKKAETVTGSMINGITQFVTGFATGGNILRTVGWGNKAYKTRATVQGLYSDFAAFDGHEERLANMLSEYPGLHKPVTDYLSADPKDTEAEGRLKNTLEGMIPDTLLAVTLKGLKAIKQARAAKAGSNYVKSADQFVSDLKPNGLPSSGRDPYEAIGDSSPMAPLVIRGRANSSVGGRASIAKKNVADAEGATGSIKPEDLAPRAYESPLASKIPVGDTFINFARINTDDDIKSVVRTLISIGKKDITDAQRGVRTNAQTIAAADSKYDEVWRGLVSRRQGDMSYSAEGQFALRRLWVASGEKVLDAARLAQAQTSKENIIAFRKMLVIHKLIQDQAMAMRTETARALQQWNIPVGVGGKEKLDAMQRILVNNGGDDVSTDLVKRFAGLAEEVAANPKAMGKMARAVEGAAEAKTIKAVSELWIGLGLLSSPKTQLRNLIGSMGMTATAVGERAIASRIERGLMDDQSEMVVGEAARMVAGIFFNTRMAWADAVHTFKTGEMKHGRSQFDIPMEMAMRQLDQNTLLGKTMYSLSYAPQLVFRLMSSGDQFMKTANFQGEAAALAYRMAVHEGREKGFSNREIADRTADILASLPKNIEEAAHEAAGLRTFTNDPGRATRYVLLGRERFPLARFIVPFVNTVGNITRTSIEYSPLAPALRKYRDDIKAGGTRATMANTKIALGTTALLEAINQCMDGNLTGRGPNPGTPEYEALSRSGWKPYSAKLGGHWVSYSNIQPFSTVLAAGANICEYMRYADDSDELMTVEGVKDLLAIGTFSIADFMLDQTMLAGTSRLFEAITDAKTDGPRWMDDFVASFVPRIATDVRQAIDPIERDARTMSDAILNKVPWGSMLVTEKRDEWGRVKSKESGWGKAYDIVSPFRASPIAIEPIDREILYQGFGVGHTVRGMELDDVQVSFKNRPHIYNRYLQLRGQTLPSDMGEHGKRLKRRYGDMTMLEVLNGVITGDHKLALKYEKMTDGADGEKHQLLKRIVLNYGKAARKALVDEFPEIREDVEKEEAERLKRAEQGDAMFGKMLEEDEVE